MVEARAQRAPQLQEIASVRSEDGREFPYFLDRGDPQLRELERQARETLGEEWIEENTVSVGGTTFASENFNNLARAVGGEPVSFEYEGVRFHPNGHKPDEGGFVSIGGVKFYPKEDKLNGQVARPEGRYGENLRKFADEVNPGNLDSAFGRIGLKDLEGLVHQSVGFTEKNSASVNELIEIAQKGNFKEREEAIAILAAHLFGMLAKMAHQFPEGNTVSRLDLIQEGYLQILIALPYLDITRHPIRYLRKAVRNAMRNLVYGNLSSRPYSSLYSGGNTEDDTERDKIEFGVVSMNPTEETALDVVELARVKGVLFEALGSEAVRESQRAVVIELYGLNDGNIKTMPELAEMRGVTKQAINRVDKEVAERLRKLPAVQGLAGVLLG